ncbi:MAG: hypothetical protein M0Z66_03580 [Thermaerobacter sp.]|nr:hypothetical protein [Thermaerobacter sp.]
MNMPVLPPFKVFEAAFAPSTWAAGEDYLLQDRVQELRRAGRSLAGRVLGVRGDYWVRCALGEPPVSVCSCGRPRCRHAAAIVQAYYSRRVPARDADAVIDAFMEHPRRAPLAAAALGEDLLNALALPAERAEDLASLPEEQAILRMQEALQAAPDKAALLCALLPQAAAPGPTQDLVRAWLGDLAWQPQDWLRFYSAAPLSLLAFLEAIEPPDWPAELHPSVIAALWQSAAADVQRLPRLAAVAARHAPKEAFAALRSLAEAHPSLIAPMLAAGDAVGSLGRALGVALRIVASLPPGEQKAALADILAAAGSHPKVRAEALLRRAAQVGDARALLAARRAAVRAGNWPRLRRLVPALLRERKDALALETRLLLADGDLDAAARVAARSRTSSLPERLVAEALRLLAPAEARLHELRADAIAKRLGEEPDDGPESPGYRPQEDRTRPRKD